MGFLLFPIYGMLMGLRLGAPRAAGAPLLPDPLDKSNVVLEKKYVWLIDQEWGQDGWILAKFFFLR